jgi:DNA-binding SARP family transcriptional activator
MGVTLEVPVSGTNQAIVKNGKHPPLKRLWYSIQDLFVPPALTLLADFPPDSLKVITPSAEKPVAASVALAPEVLASADVPPSQASLPLLTVYCFGPFRVYCNEHPVQNWPGRKCKSVLKYLISAHRRSVAKEVLMELFWPDADPDAARNNLNVTIYGLRQALREADDSVSHILFQDDSYMLNSDIPIWVDSEAFLVHVARGKQMEQGGNIDNAIREFCAAEALYQGEYMEDDRYEDWLTPHRQLLQEHYLTILNRLSQYYFEKHDLAAAITVCRKILSVDGCHESAHRYLMACYQEQGQNHLALRQYHLCTETLHDELNMSPSPKTTELYWQIRKAPSVGGL